MAGNSSPRLHLCRFRTRTYSLLSAAQAKVKRRYACVSCAAQFLKQNIRVRVERWEKERQIALAFGLKPVPRRSPAFLEGGPPMRYH